MFQDLLCKHRDLPGAILSQPLKQVVVTSRGKEINCEAEIGASLSIPRNSLVNDVKVGVTASFSGSYETPDDVEPVSPVYAITTDKEIECDKDITFRMQHTSGGDGHDLLLMEAKISSTHDTYVLEKSTKKMECSLGKKRFLAVKFKKLASRLYRLVKPKPKKEGRPMDEQGDTVDGNS